MIPTTEENPGAHTLTSTARRSPRAHRALAAPGGNRVGPHGKMGTLKGSKPQSAGTPRISSPPSGRKGRQAGKKGRWGDAGMSEGGRAGLESQVTTRTDPHVPLGGLCDRGRADLHSVSVCVRLLPGHVGGESVRNAVFASERDLLSPTREA